MDINSLLPLLNNLMNKKNCNNCNSNSNTQQAVKIQTEVLNTYPTNLIDDKQETNFQQNNNTFYPQNSNVLRQTENNTSNQSNFISQGNEGFNQNNNQQNQGFNPLSMIMSLLGNGSFDIGQLSNLLSNGNPILSAFTGSNKKETEKKNSPKISEFVKVDEQKITDYWKFLMISSITSKFLKTTACSKIFKLRPVSFWTLSSL